MSGGGRGVVTRSWFQLYKTLDWIVYDFPINRILCPGYVIRHSDWPKNPPITGTLSFQLSFSHSHCSLSLSFSLLHTYPLFLSLSHTDTFSLTLTLAHTWSKSVLKCRNGQNMWVWAKIMNISHSPFACEAMANGEREVYFNEQLTFCLMVTFNSLFWVLKKVHLNWCCKRFPRKANFQEKKGKNWQWMQGWWSRMEKIKINKLSR